MDITAMMNERADLYEELRRARNGVDRVVCQPEGKAEARLRKAIAALKAFDDKVNKQLGL